MDSDQLPLFVSMMLQGLVGVTFGLAFVGTWRAFQRPAALFAAIAWLLYAIGLWMGLGSMAFGLARSWPPAMRGLVGVPALLGVLFFRPAMEAVLGWDLRRALRSYVAVCAGAALILTVGRAAISRWLPEIAPFLFPYVVPRTVVALAFAWAAVPLLRRRTPSVAHIFTGALLLALAVLMAATTAFEFHPQSLGQLQHSDSLLLSMLQVGLMILLGVSTSVLLTESEAARALADARTIRQTAEALQASEERFRFVAEHSSDMHLLVGADYRIRYASASCERLLGVPAAALEGQLAADILDDDDRATAKSAFDTLAADPSITSWPVLTIHVRHRSGAQRLFEVRGRTVPEPGASFGGPAMVFSLRDVTDTRRVEEEMRQAQKMEAIGRLAGGVAHDFNNMMMAITGQCELVVLRQPAGKDLVRALHEVQQVANSAAALSQQLLAFGRRQALQPRVVSLNLVCERSFQMLRRLIREDTEIRFVPAPDLRRVRADPSGLEQILMNLCVNARDAMPNGGTITVGTANAAFDAPLRIGEDELPAGRYVVLRVTDTGVGMDEATRRQIFEPFFTTKEPGKGTGLGLAVVYGVVRQSGGAIAVDSQTDAGSTFSVYLPVTDAPYDAELPLASSTGPARGSETILLVEDNDAVRSAIASYLSAAGYRVLAAHSGVAALDLVRDQAQIHALLTDVVMPGLTGPQIAETLIARHPELRVLYLSGHPRDVLPLDATLPPRTALAQKPIPLENLLREVRTLLDAP